MDIRPLHDRIGKSTSPVTRDCEEFLIMREDEELAVIDDDGTGTK